MNMVWSVGLNDFDIMSPYTVLTLYAVLISFHCALKFSKIIESVLVLLWGAYVMEYTMAGSSNGFRLRAIITSCRDSTESCGKRRIMLFLWRSGC